jgi:hypothetical protein
MAVITEPNTGIRRRKPSNALDEARRHTRELAFGEIIGAVFPISVGTKPDQKAWYRVNGLRPLTLEWLPYTQYRIDPAALADLSKQAIYRLIETDI